MAVSGSGFLNSVTTKIRLYTDELGAATSKFSDNTLVDMVRRAFNDVIEDVNRTSKNAIRARLDISVTTERHYILPPTIGRILEFKKLDSNGDLLWEIVPRHPLSPSGPGFTIEGPIMRFDPQWQQSETMRLEYIPNANAPIFECTAASATASTITTGGSITAGSVDLRANAYLGYVCRVISESDGGTKQDRVISAQDDTTPAAPVFTVEPDFSPTPAGTVVFEVVPAFAHRFEDVIALKVARFLSSTIGNRDRMQTLQTEYLDAIRSLKLSATQRERRGGHKMQRVVRGRRRFGVTR